jgi:hypothetical protein
LFKLGRHKLVLMPLLGVGTDEVGEEEKLQYQEYDGHLD